jgi:hypothetical protein
VQEIRDILDSLNLKTEPDFEVAWIDEPIWLKLKDENLAAHKSRDHGSEVEPTGDSAEVVLEGTPAAVEQAEEQTKAALTSEEPAVSTNPDSGNSILADDPTFRIGSLPAANKRLIVVNRDAPRNEGGYSYAAA